VKRRFLAAPVLLAAIAVLAVDTAPARAEGRPVPVAGTTLQNYFSVTVLESINVGTDQVADTQRWKTTVSGNSAMTLMIELASDANGNALGVYNAGDVSPALFEIFPGTAVAGQYAMASFRPLTSQLLVTVFNGDGTVASSVTHNGVTTNNFGYYIQHAAGGTGYSQDARNAGDTARMLVFKGTGDNAGNWWMCFEDNNPDDPDDDRDFDDAVVFVESINPTPVAHTSWGALKSRFR